MSFPFVQQEIPAEPHRKTDLPQISLDQSDDQNASSRFSPCTAVRLLSLHNHFGASSFSRNLIVSRYEMSGTALGSVFVLRGLLRTSTSDICGSFLRGSHMHMLKQCAGFHHSGRAREEILYMAFQDASTQQRLKSWRQLLLFLIMSTATSMCLWICRRSKFGQDGLAYLLGRLGCCCYSFATVSAMVVVPEPGRYITRLCSLATITSAYAPDA